jgi:hypothetical protein
MRAVPACLWLLLGCALVMTPASAQEVQVPLDSAGQLTVIDAKTAHRLGLFQNHAVFQDARMFQTSDSTFILEISFQSDGKLLRERKPLSKEEVIAFRNDVTTRMRVMMPHAGLDRSGRAELVGGTTLLAIGYHAWAVPVGLHVNAPSAYVGSYFIASGAGFLIPFLATENTSVTHGEAILAMHGATRGLAHGVCLWYLFGGKTGDDGRGAYVTASAASIAEEIIAFQVADRSRISTGNSKLLCVGEDFGMAIGLGTAQLAGAFKSNGDSRLSSGLVLAGGALGIVAANAMSKAEEYADDDALIVRVTGILGAGTSMVAAHLAKVNGANAYVAAGMAGLIVGSGIGHRLTRNENFSGGQGRLISLGTIGSGLLGLGVATLTRSHDSRLYTSLTAVSATAGFIAMYRTFASDARIACHDGDSRWNLQLTPQSLVSRDRGGSAHFVPGANLQIQF